MTSEALGGQLQSCYTAGVNVDNVGPTWDLVTSAGRRRAVTMFARILIRLTLSVKNWLKVETSLCQSE